MALLSEEINYCMRCGTRLEQAERFGRLRPVCPQCGWVFFPDPKVAVAVLVMQNDQVLLVRRANNPMRGLWTLPAGFMDAGEDPRQAAERECLEETGLTVRAGELIDVIYGLEHSRGAHLVIFYRAELLDGELHAKDDVDSAAFYSLYELPPLAFKTTQIILDRIS